jgi:hypothetical protein
VSLVNLVKGSQDDAEEKYLIWVHAWRTQVKNMGEPLCLETLMPMIGSRISY